MKWSAVVVWDGEVFHLEPPLPLVPGHHYTLTIKKKLTEPAGKTKQRAVARKRTRNSARRPGSGAGR